MYHCGPTVNAPINISKFRSYLLADILRRTLETHGLKIRQESWSGITQKTNVNNNINNVIATEKLNAARRQ